MAAKEDDAAATVNADAQNSETSKIFANDSVRHGDGEHIKKMTSKFAEV